MEPLLFVMAIMGCGDGTTQCSEQRVVEARYETLQQCQADTAQQLYRNSDISYPVIMTACRSVGARFADRR
jgi:hypothetical protein